jgi:integrase
MASVYKTGNGRRSIQFTAPDGKRPVIRLGKVSQRAAESVKVHVERLVNAKVTGYPVEDETARWLASLDDKLSGRLARLGLTNRRESHKASTISTLKAFTDKWIGDRYDVKEGTRTVYGHAQRNLLDFFKAEKPLSDITPGDADEFRLHLIGQGLAENTVRKRTKIARQFMQAAVRKKLIDSNPFADLKTSVLKNRDRDYFVTHEEATLVNDACPDAQWRMIFALCRYGGLRCPSEIMELKWSDVDWDRDRILVTSPKTERYPDGATRMIPLFPELVGPLTEAFELAEPGELYVVTRYRDPAQNLRTQLGRIIKKAGIQPWPKPFQNLRSSRETELAEEWPIHVVCDWIGNSEAVAKTHYLQVTDEHFERASTAQPKALQDALQNAHESGCTAKNSTDAERQEAANLPGNSTACASVQNEPLGPVGFEPTTNRL